MVWNKKGFTLIELMVAITIIAILSTIGYVTYSHAQLAARDARRKNDLRSVAEALTIYYQTHTNQYPPTSGNFFSSSGILVTQSDINQMPTDPSGGTYHYWVDGTNTSYVLCAQLENTSDPDIYSGSVTNLTTWGCSTSDAFVLQSP